MKKKTKQRDIDTILTEPDLKPGRRYTGRGRGGERKEDENERIGYK